MVSLEQWHNLISIILNKIRFQKFCVLLGKTGLSPNVLTIISVSIGLISAFFLFTNQVAFIICIVIASILDISDGYYARVINKQSTLGEILDHGGDALVSFVLLVTCALVLHNWQAYAALTIWILFVVVSFYKKTLRQIPPYRLFIFFFMLKLYNLGLVIYTIRQLFTLIVMQIPHKK